MSTINLGNIVTQNGRSTAVGVSSGIDSSSLIDGILSAQQSSIDDITDEITTHEAEISALAELRTLLTNFKDAATGLRNAPGVNNETDNYFLYRDASVTSDDGETYITATASAGASTGSFEITDVNLAKAHIIRRTGFESRTDSVVDGTDADVDGNYSYSSDTLVGNNTLSTSAPITFTNGVDTAGTNASIEIVFSSDNEFDSSDTLTFGATALTFGGGGGDDLDLSGATNLEDKLAVIANYMNSITSGDESEYTYTTDGVDTIIVTRNTVGSDSTNMTVSSNFSSGSTNQTVTIGDVAATNGSTSGTVADNGTDGIDTTYLDDDATTPIDLLSGAITINSIILNEGDNNSNSTIDFNPNTLTFAATIGGETYTATVTLLNGSIDTDSNGDGDNGTGLSGFGNRIAAGTVIEFTRDDDSGTDVQFQFVVGSSDITIDDQTDANTLASDLQDFLDDNNVEITNDNKEFRAGTLTIGTVAITIEEGDNLNEIKAKINSVSDSTNVQAEIVEVADGSYTLVLKATSTGTDYEISEFSAGFIQFGNDSEAFSELQAAEDATFTYDGITITRSSNTITDLLDDITITLVKEDGGAATSTVTVSENQDVAQNGIVDFLNYYNELKSFVAVQTERDEDGNYVDTAILGDNSLIRSILQDVEDELTTLVSGLDDADIDDLSDIGVTFTDYAGDDETPAVANIFELDFDALSEALSADFDAVRKLFEFDMSSDSSELTVFQHTNDISLTSFTLDIDTSRDEDDQVRVLDADTGETLFNMTLSGVAITGQDGTTLEGLTLIYTGDGEDTISVTLTQGLADRVFNALDSVLEDDGLLDDEVSTIQDSISTLEDREEDETETLENDREQLISEFAALESAISSFNNTLTFLEAQRDAINSG